MPEQLDAELNLDFDQALSGVEHLRRELEEALSSATERFEDEFSRAVNALSPAEIEVEATGVDAMARDIESAVEGVDGGVEVTATGTDTITQQIDTAIAAATGEVDIGADTARATEQLGEFVHAVSLTEAVVEIDAEVTGEDEVEALSENVEEAGEAAGEATGHVTGFGNATEALGGVAGAATGEIGAAADIVGAFSGKVAVAVGAVTALSFGITELIRSGIEGSAAQQRFTQVLGEEGEAIEKINLNGYVTDLAKLARQMGSTEAATQNAAASNFQFALNAGASRGEASRFTQSLFVLAARAVALKPSLGDVSDVAASMSARLGRARAAAQSFGIAISQTEVNDRAMANTNKESSSQLTAYEKSLAAAQLALERYGPSLKATISEGSKNAAIQQRALRAEFDDFLESAGKKLVVPAFQALREGIPVAKEAATVLGQVADEALPAVGTALETVQPFMGSITVAILAFGAASKLVIPVVQTIADRVDKFKETLPDATPKLDALTSGLDRTAKALPGVAIGIGLVATSIGDMGNSAEGAITGIAGFASIGQGIGAAFGHPAIGAGIGALAGGIVALGQAVTDTGPDIEEYRQQFREMASELDNLNQANALKKFIDTLGETDRVGAGLDKMKNGVVQTTREWYHFDAALGKNVTTVSQVRPKIRELTNEVESLAEKSPAAARKVVDGFITLRTESGKAFFNPAQILALNQALETGATRLKNRNERAEEAAAANEKLLSTEKAVAGGISNATQKVIDEADATRDATEAKQAQIDTLTNYLDTLRAAQDVQFAATKANRDATQADKDLADAVQNVIDTNKDAEATELDKKLAVEGVNVATQNAIKAHEDAAVAYGDASVATMEGADANVIAKLKVDKTVESLEYQKSQVEEGGPVWKALNDYQQKILKTPEYIATKLRIDADVAEARAKAVALQMELQRMGFDISVPLDTFIPPTGAEGMVIPPRPGGSVIIAGEAGATEILVPTDDRARAISLLQEGGLGDLLGAGSAYSSGPITTRSYAPYMPGAGTSHVDRSITAPITIIEATDPFDTASAVVRRFATYQYLAGP